MTDTPMNPDREAEYRALIARTPGAGALVASPGALRELLAEVDRLRARLAELKARPAKAEAHPAKTQWAVEIYDPRHSTWVTPTRFHAPEVAADAQAAYEKNTPMWTDGSPVQHRIVREETTYTVDTDLLLDALGLEN